MKDDVKAKILDLLSEREMAISDLSRELGLTKATVLHHIKHLSEEGLIRVTREERVKNFIKKYYTVSIPNGGADKKLMDEIRLSIKNMSGEEFSKGLTRFFGLGLLSTSPYLLRKVGFEVGYEVFGEVIKDNPLDELADIWEKLKMGVVTEVSSDKIVVEDCYFCSNLPNIGKTYCKFDEGLISGALEKATGDRYVVREEKCWGNGYEFCEFSIKKIKI